MRPQANAHCGFYPLTEGAAKIAAEQLRVEGDPRMVSVLDPCVGDGVAIKRICDALSIPYENITAVELTRNRGEEAAALLPGAKVISPCCFLSGTNRPERAFTFVYCNPPFSAEVGGGYRVETQFLDKIKHMVPIGSVLCMVVPYQTSQTYYFTNTLAESWRRVRITRLKPEDAPYNEVIITAYRANNKPAWGTQYNVNWESTELTMAQYDPGDAPPLANPEKYGDPFSIPMAKRLVDLLHKTQLTTEEIKGRLIESTIEFHVSTPPPINRGRPPLALGTGHNGILVASGQAPPIVTRRDGQGRMLEIPHLIRGVARKVTYVKHEEESESTDDGSVKKKTVLSEAVDLKITVLLHTGQVIDLNEERDAIPIEKPQDGMSVLPSESNSNGHGGIAV